jgi:hypothetical protein
MTALTGEVGELANFLKKWRRGDMPSGAPEIGRELADILIYLDILAGELGFDLAAETVSKFNATSDKIGSDVKLGAAVEGDAQGVQAVRDVADERRRQQASEGYEPEHDDEQVRGELAYAAACYALSGAQHPERVPGIWPWQPGAFKPKSRREDLVRAGALILAEIERLDRAALTDQPADYSLERTIIQAARHWYVTGDGDALASALARADQPAQDGGNGATPENVNDYLNGHDNGLNVGYCQGWQDARERAAWIAETCGAPEVAKHIRDDTPGDA